MKTLAAFTLLVVVLVGGTAVVVSTRLETPFRGYADAERFVDIPPGAGTAAIGSRLVDAGVVRDQVTFRLALWRAGVARRLKAGEYRFETPMTPADVLAKIARGDVTQIVVTFPEGLTVVEMSKIFEARGLGPSSEFVKAASDPSAARKFDPTAPDLEGYLFPDTYALPRSTDAVRLVQAMADRFERALTPELLAAANVRGLTIRQLVTLASIVEKETARPEERPLVSAVYRNRLRIGMGLQCDPTVIYALQRSGRFDGNLRREDLQFESRYNTYRYPGLPPGPIAAPGKAALEAAASPGATDALYFVSRNDGSHEFASSLAEHNRNVQRFQVDYFRRRRDRASERTSPPGRSAH